MKAIAYWDIDSLRIRRVLNELKAGFDVRLAATLGELQAFATDRSFCAIVVGAPPADQESIAAMIGAIVHESPCPIFILIEKRIPLDLDRAKPGFFICSSEISSLPARILAAAENKTNGDTRASRLFIGKSSAMLTVSALVRKYAESRYPVLILGETGTGKELVANALHSCSSRRDHPFIALNCSALPENLVESELFGTEKGAFTDAVRHKGALAKAEKGSLFLDEIGSMSLSAQPKLLRALETGEYWRLGAEKSERSDFRLICATCEDLETLMRRGSFRSDLFYRISDLPINVPPLRERGEDITELAEHFCFLSGKGFCALSGEAVAKLMNYDWPGNVRELKSVINRACTNVQKGNIEDGDIIFMARSGSPVA